MFHDRMKVIGARLLVKTINGLAAGTLAGTPQQNPTNLRHAPKIFTETCRIDWNKSTSEIYNLIRGLSPFPAAFTELDGKLLKIFRSEKKPPRDSDLGKVVVSVPTGYPQTDGKDVSALPNRGRMDTGDRTATGRKKEDGSRGVLEGVSTSRLESMVSKYI